MFDVTHRKKCTLPRLSVGDIKGKGLQIKVGAASYFSKLFKQVTTVN